MTIKLSLATYLESARRRSKRGSTRTQSVPMLPTYWVVLSVIYGNDQFVAATICDQTKMDEFVSIVSL